MPSATTPCWPCTRTKYGDDGHVVVVPCLRGHQRRDVGRRQLGDRRRALLVGVLGDDHDVGVAAGHEPSLVGAEARRQKSPHVAQPVDRKARSVVPRRPLRRRCCAAPPSGVDADEVVRRRRGGRDAGGGGMATRDPWARRRGDAGPVERRPRRRRGRGGSRRIVGVAAQQARPRAARAARPRSRESRRSAAVMRSPLGAAADAVARRSRRGRSCTNGSAGRRRQRVHAGAGALPPHDADRVAAGRRAQSRRRGLARVAARRRDRPLRRRMELRRSPGTSTAHDPGRVAAVAVPVAHHRDDRRAQPKANGGRRAAGEAVCRRYPRRPRRTEHADPGTSRPLSVQSPTTGTSPGEPNGEPRRRRRRRATESAAGTTRVAGGTHRCRTSRRRRSSRP